MPAAVRFVFDRFEIDPARRRLTAAGEPVAVSDRQFDVLLLLVARAGQIISKDDLLEAGWKDVAVGDNSIEQAISSLRRLLGPPPDGAAFIETVPRRGYRFGSPVARMAPRESDAGLDALLIESDPDAEPFYRSQGAQPAGTRTSWSTGRELPLLRIST